MVRKYASTLIMLGLFCPGMAAALGLGELTLHSYLNEPLEAEVDLLETKGLDEGQIRIRLATREDFDRAGVEREYFLTSLKFEVIAEADGPGRLQITSSDPVREPFLDFLVEARWPNGRILREYTVLLDPPVLSGTGSGVTASRVFPKAVDEQRASEAATSAAAKPRYGDDASQLPAAGEKYLVQQAETLWSIARRARPAESTIQQTMLDIKRLNPEAFIGGNINQLKAGYVLRLPSTSQITDIPMAEAIAEIAEQEQSWQDNSAAIDARRMDASEGGESSGVAGSDEEQGRLQIAGVDGESSAGAQEGDLSAKLESLDQVERDNADLQSRVDSMEQQVDMLKRLVTLKDDQIAALQSALADSGQLDGPGLIDEEEGTIDAIVETLPDVAESGADPIDTAATEPVVAPQPAPAEPGPMDLLLDYGLYLLLLLLLILAAAGWFLRDRINLPGLKSLGRRRTKQDHAGGDDDDDEFAGLELVADDSLIVDEFAGDAVDGAGAAEVLTSFGAPDEEAYAAQFETGDALAEADIYIAYGRYPQAVDLLKAAISMEPVNSEYRVKLMEACVEMVDSAEFQQQYADLQVIGDEAGLQRARAMLDGVDGGEVWLDDLPEPSISTEDVEAAEAAMRETQITAEAPPAAAQSAATDGEEIELAGLDLDLDADTDDVDMMDLSLDDDALGSLDADDELGLDLEFDLDAAAAEPDLEMELAPEGFADEPELELLEDELDDGLLSLDDDALNLGEPEAEPELAELDAETDDDDLDLSQFDMGDFKAAGGTADATDEDDDSELELPDFELDELTASMSAADSESQPELEQASEPDLELAPELESGDLNDFGDLSFEDDEPALDSGDDSLEIDLEPVADDAADDDPDPETDTDTETGSFDLDTLESFTAEDAESEAEEEPNGNGLMFAADGDEIATKLDLARAYLDMGDHEGASSILQEVLQDGSDSQREEAQSLLDSID